MVYTIILSRVAGSLEGRQKMMKMAKIGNFQFSDFQAPTR